MPKVLFKLDILKDARNYYDTASSDINFGHDFTKSLRPEVYKKLKGKKWEVVKEYITHLLKNGYEKDKEKIENKLNEIKDGWNKIQKKYFKQLEKITKKKIYREEFICYITTIGRCPYNVKENWFMTNIFQSVDKIFLTIAHELMHLQFHHYFEKQLRKKISYKQFQDIKEALTVLLNVEFRDIIKEEDKGYTDHIELRAFIKETWKKEKDFDKLLKSVLDNQV